MVHQKDKDKKEQYEKSKDLIKDLALKLLQTMQVLKLPNTIPEEEKKTIEELLECASQILFRMSLLEEKDLNSTADFLQAAMSVKDHNEEVQDRALKYAPEKPHAIKPHTCNHPLSKSANEFDEILKSLGRVESMMAELKQFEKKEHIHRLKKYNDKAFSC